MPKQEMTPLKVNLWEPDYDECEYAINDILEQVPSTWVPALLAKAMQAANARKVFSFRGMSNTAKKIEES